MIKKEQTKSIPITKLMVWEAYKKVKANKGSAGVDGLSLKEFNNNLSSNLYKIWNRLTSGSYFPLPVKEVAIPKKDGKKRMLGIPTVGDRIAQMVIKNHIEERIDKQFHKNSYGYRPLKSAHDALEQVRINTRNYNWVIDLDIKGFFDNIDHELLIRAIDRHVEERWVKMYLIRWLEMPVKKAEGELKQSKGKGTPQGGVISPLLANLFLHYAFDKWLELTYPTVKFVRYADDAIIHCKSKEESEAVLVALKDRLEKCKLQLHPEKTKIAYCKDYKRKDKYDIVKFDFLGYSFQPRPTKSKRDGKMFLGFDLAISNESKKRIIQEITSTCFHRWSTATFEDLAELLNPRIRGWLNYYGKYRRYELSVVFRNLDYRLTKWIRNRYKRFGAKMRDSYKFLKRINKENPTLFAHWAAGFKA